LNGSGENGVAARAESKKERGHGNNGFAALSGALRIPMLTLATSRDPVVPGFHQISYRDVVTAAGASDFLVQREIERYGHLTFTPDELSQAFSDLVLWVEVRREAGAIELKPGFVHRHNHQ
jgi:hypothetical protein